jgi:hypothetical protein
MECAGARADIAEPAGARNDEGVRGQLWKGTVHPAHHVANARILRRCAVKVAACCSSRCGSGIPAARRAAGPRLTATGRRGRSPPAGRGSTGRFRNSSRRLTRYSLAIFDNRISAGNVDDVRLPRTKKREARRDPGPILPVLQLRPGVSDAPRDASDGSGTSRPCLGHRRNRRPHRVSPRI